MARASRLTAEMWVTSCPFECFVLDSPDSLNDFLEMTEINVVRTMNLAPRNATGSEVSIGRARPSLWASLASVQRRI